MDLCRDYERQAALLKALAHPVRLRIMDVLVCEGRRNVRGMEKRTGVSQSCLSQHLQRLRAARLVAAERVGNEVYYRACAPEAAGVLAVLTGEERSGDGV